MRGFRPPIFEADYCHCDHVFCVFWQPALSSDVLSCLFVVDSRLASDWGFAEYTTGYTGDLNLLTRVDKVQGPQGFYLLTGYYFHFYGLGCRGPPNVYALLPSGTRPPRQGGTWYTSFHCITLWVLGQCCCSEFVNHNRLRWVHTSLI